MITAFTGQENFSGSGWMSKTLIYKLKNNYTPNVQHYNNLMVNNFIYPTVSAFHSVFSFLPLKHLCRTTLINTLQ